VTSRERILATLEHREPDRCATYLWIDDDCLRALAERLSASDLDGVEQALGIDRWRPVSVPLRAAQEDADIAHRFVPDEFKAMKDVCIHDNGMVERVHPDARYLEDLIWHPLQAMTSPDELDAYPLPGPERIVPDGRFEQEIRALKESDAVVFAELGQPFKTAWHLRGMENLFCDFLESPAFVDALYDRLYAFVTAQACEAAHCGVDVVEVVGDIAMQDRLMMSPDIWRKYDKHRLASLIRAVKQVRPDTRIYFHSDGDVGAIVPDLVEVGLDILNPIQPECMDACRLKAEWGDRLVLHGGVSVQHTIPLGTPDMVRDEVIRLVETCGGGGGFVLGPSNVLIREFPLENIIAMYEAV
jgi:uroporphyrinogen decarboxylase